MKFLQGVIMRTNIFFAFIWIITTSALISQIPNKNLWIPNNDVYAIAVDSTYTYIGGAFTSVGPNTGQAVQLSTTNPSPNLSFPKITGIVRAIISDANGGWYVGGSFSQIGGYPINNLAHLYSDGTVDQNWAPNPNSTITAIAINGTNIFVIGGFSTIGGQNRKSIAKLNNTNGNADSNWNIDFSAGQLITPSIDAIAISGDDIYVGGNFTTIGGVTKKYVAKLNNINGLVDPNWDANSNNIVSHLFTNGSDIYVTGYFSSIGGQTRSCVARLNNTNGNADPFWNPNAVGIDALVVDSNAIYVGGDFRSIGGSTIQYIAKLNSTTGAADPNWAPNPNLRVYAVCLSDSDVFVGGDFTNLGGQERHRLAKLKKSDGSVNSSWDPNADDRISTMAINQDKIYAGGRLTSAGNVSMNKIARLYNKNGALDLNWIPDANGAVYNIVIDGDDVYVGGGFTYIGRQSRSRIAKLDKINGNASTNWDPHADSDVEAIAISGIDMYVGGLFNSIAGRNVHKIAKLNKLSGEIDTCWNPQIDDGRITSIAINNSDVFAGGIFTSIGGQTRQSVAKLNGTDGKADVNWDARADSHAEIYVIKPDGDDLYLGGWFKTIGGQTIQSIARLNKTDGNADTSWHPMPVEQNDVHSICINKGDLYLGGNFGIDFKTVTLHELAKINKSTGKVDTLWNPHPNGMVWSIVNSGDDIYVGGSFDQVSGLAQTGLAVFTDRNLAVEPHKSVVVDFEMTQNYPNPFNPSTTIRYSLKQTGLVKLAVYDILGKEVQVLVNTVQPAGTHMVNFNASSFASGVYFYTLRAGDNIKTKKMMLLK